MYKVAAIYHIWPHYRRGVMQAMDRSEAISYEFLGADVPYQGILPVGPSDVRQFRQTRLRWYRSLLWQWDGVAVALSSQYDAIIYLSDMHFISSWLGAMIARLKGKSVLFWGHGWLAPEKSTKAYLRNMFYRLSNQIMVYNERSAMLGSRSGFPKDKITVIYNSLDVRKADDVLDRLECGDSIALKPQDLFVDSERPLLICTARITSLCRFDVLLQSAAILAAQGRPVNVLLVGDGPERAALEALAAKLGVSAHFYGACYDENIIGSLICHADLTVSPGKIGLTAMHSLMYGTPAITHDNLDQQMPEVEALVPGVTGDFFEQGDPSDLAKVISRWLDTDRSRAEVRAACRSVIRNKWHPDVQARIIEQAILKALRHV